ncbi:hypothetical protein LSH36_571g02012 [Paralvinella palmiformis]|uniref:Threonine aspartase 1 n=1 Tax=Paralvinella palmiformis TaxID=53620 RepID=A0AAD9J600_9ANNE|nr:hypothetical protein LSH36_571g02012 [Paralvinella palmiformis]
MSSVGVSHGGFIAVHGGAGYHSPANSQMYKDVCRNACQRAIRLLHDRKSAVEAVAAAVMALEDSACTNAGIGSNLTVNGTVECDASIMDGDSLHYGAVGAVSGVKNPVLLAENLLRTQQLGNMALGRVPPSTLVGDGARDWAVRNDISVVCCDELITESAKKSYTIHKRKLDQLNAEMDSDLPESCHKRVKLERSAPDLQNGDDSLFQNSLDSHLQNDLFQDTVGAVCVDHSGHVASAVSSGGIILKQPGRLGQAALYGCGCWAENDPVGKFGVGVSTSGCGEHLTKTLLARECGQCLKSGEDPIQAISDTFRHKFLKSPFIRNVEKKLGGALAVKVDSVDQSRLDVDVLWVHTTDSMCLGFMSTQDASAKAFISRLPEGKRCGKAYIVQSKNISISKVPGT